MEKSNLPNFGLVPLKDWAWAMNQKPAVNRLFQECWLCDPYGNRWMQLNTILKDRAFREAKKKLSDQGLFIFKRETSIRDTRSTVCWMIRNLHGSRVKGYRESPKATTSDGTAMPDPNPKSGTVMPPISPETLAQQTAQDRPMDLDADLGITMPEFGISMPEFGITMPEFGISMPEFGTAMPPISSQTLIESGVQERPESFQYPIGSISSSISARDRAPEESGEEEEIKILKKGEEEADQGNGVKPEGLGEPEVASQPESMSEPEAPVKPEAPSTSQPPASLEVESEVTDQPKDLGLDRDFAAPPQKSDVELLDWLVKVKIPALELNEAPRNLLAYAKAMIRRDGDALREEFEEVARDRQFREECASLTEKLEVRVEEWRQAGVNLILFYAFDGRPQVLLDGITIPGDEFLKRPIGSQPALQPISAFLRPEDAAKRKSRLIRLKFAEKFGECPSLEFLTECWGDVLLRSQVQQTIRKHPRWGMFINDQDQLEQLGEHPAEMQNGVLGSQPSHDQVEFPQPQEIQMAAELHPSDTEYQYLKHLAKSEIK